MEDVSSITLVGRNLQQLRKANGYTQQQISEYLDITQSLVSKIEHGERNINMTMLEKLALLYDVNDWDLLSPLTDYTPVNVRYEGVVDLNAVAKMNQVKGHLRLLRGLQ